ncbi:hypothetical protein [Flavobacterium sp. W22_SRS_FP1]|uniref:hypothetical protein n=1 Tax=Flavobacterium sp. W22_SRS_FP1 TaxID=3240276 RepID=UPI003F8E0A75
MMMAKFDTEDYGSAIADFDKAIILNPNDSDSYSLRGNTKLLIVQTQSACLDWHKAEELLDKEASSSLQNIVSDTEL